MRRRQLRIVLAAFLLSIVAWAGSLFIIPPGAANAQTFVIGSNPVDGSTINEIPSIVRIYFNAPLSSLSNAHVYALPDGQQVDVNAAHSSVSPTNPRELDTPLRPTTDLPRGSYEVMWTAIDNTDGHTTFGLIGFNVGFSGTGLPGTPTLGPSTSNDLTDIRALNTVNLLSILWEWIILVGITLWIGLLVVERLLSANAGRTLLLIERVQKQTYALQWLCLTVLLLAECVSMVLRSIYLSTASQLSAISPHILVALILTTNYGWLWLLRIAVLLIAMVLLFLSGRITKVPEPTPIQHKIPNSTGPLRQYVTGELRMVTTASLPRERVKHETTTERTLALPRYHWLLLALAGTFLLAHVLSGDSTQVLQPHISALVFDWLYFVAQSIWFGGLTCLGYILLPALSAVEHDHHTEILSPLLRRLSPYLITAVAAQLLCRLFLSEASIGNSQQLLSDDYGRTVLVQGSLTVILLGFALYMLFVLRPRLMRQALLLPVVNAELPARRMRQTSLDQSRQALKHITRIQSWLGAGLLLCSALMAFFAPPIVFPDVNYNNQTTLAPAPTPVNTQTQHLGPFTVTLQLLPAKAGAQNTVTLHITGPDGKPVTNAKVQIDTNMQIMNMGTGHVTLVQGNPAYTTTFDAATAFNMAGAWSVAVRIEQPGQAPVQGTFRVMVS